MDAAATNSPTTPLPGDELARIWVRHLCSLLIPVTTIAFLWTGPHAWYIAPLFMLPPIFAVNWDSNATVELRQPAPQTPAWPFDALVYLLAALHFYIIYELAVLFTQQGFFSIDTVMVVVVVGGNSGFSIITAHELIHRSKPWERLLGRLMLCTVLQEHFYTEHLRGHHVKVGLPEDPATARFGERYSDFYKRTVPAQIKSAWQIEKKRLGDADLSLFDARLLHNRLLQGLLAELVLALAIFAHFGTTSFVIFLLQAFMASRLLEAVNYMEHWGLRRTTRNVRPVDSWDTHSWFTYYGLTGLSRHADHHRDPTRPYQELEVFDEAPLLPTGYLDCVDMVVNRNDEFRQKAVRELQQRRLGPFSPETDPAEAAEAGQIADEILAVEIPAPAGLFGPNEAGETGLRAVLPRLAFWGAVLLAATLGVQLESGAALPFVRQFSQSAWILIAFVLMIRSYRALKERQVNDSVAWSIAMGLLVLLGVVSA